MIQKMNEYFDSQNQRIWLPRGIQWRLLTEAFEVDGQQSYDQQRFGNQLHGFGHQPIQHHQRQQQRKVTKTVHWIEIDLVSKSFFLALDTNPFSGFKTTSAG